jgi:hypothetical protein
MKNKDWIWIAAIIGGVYLLSKAGGLQPISGIAPVVAPGTTAPSVSGSNMMIYHPPGMNLPTNTITAGGGQISQQGEANFGLMGFS